MSTLLLTLLLLSSGEGRFIGLWEGKLNVGPAQIRMVFHIEEGEDGQLFTLIDSPDQGATGIETSGTTVDGDNIHVDVALVGGSFAGVLIDDGMKLQGMWSQAGNELPLAMIKVEELTKPNRPQEPKPPFPYTERGVAVDAGEFMLAGTLTIPDGEGPFPGAVLVSGSGPQDRDESIMSHKPFWVLADHLARQGIAVLRYDDRGFGESGGQHKGATSMDFARDARAVLNFLQAREETGDCGIIGHSEGGMIATVVAAFEDDMDFAVLLAAPAIRGLELMLAQNRALLAASYAHEAFIESAEIMNRSLYEASISAKSDDQVRPSILAVLEELQEKIDPAIATRVGLSPDSYERFVQEIGSSWFRWFLQYDPKPDLESLRIPTFALFGTLDLQVPPSVNEDVMRQALSSAGSGSEVRVFEGLNHLFQHATTGGISEYAQIEETIAPEVLNAVSAWVLANAGN